MRRTSPVFWASLAIALFVSGGLFGLQTASIVAAFPFAVVLLLTFTALVTTPRAFVP